MKRFALISMSLAAILAASAVVSVQAETITHRYNYENNANDSVGTLNGTASAGISYTTDSKKSGNYSLLTSSDGGYIDMPSYNLGSQFSISFWLNPSTISGQALMANSTGGWGVDGFRMYFGGWTGTTDKQVYFEVGDGTNGNVALTSDTNGVLTTGSWNHVVATIDQASDTKSIKIYVNGNEKANCSQNFNFNASGIWTIGGWNVDGEGGHGPLLRGGSGLDDVQVYSGVLSGEQVDYLYDHPGAAIPEPSAMVLVGMGAVSLLAYAWRKRKSA